MSWRPLPIRDVEMPERRGAVERQLAWAQAGGAHWDGIEFRFGDAVKVFATGQLDKGSTILTLPRSLWILDDELGMGDLPPRDALAAWLPHQHTPYTDALPARFPLPLFDREPPVGSTRAHVAEDVFRSYERVRDRVSLEDFAWGCAVVISRGFHAPGTFDHRVAMLPLVELLDHRPGDTTWIYDPRDGDFVLSTARTFSAGEEVCFSYGNRSNGYLRAHYGFELPDNPFDECVVLFDDARLCVGRADDDRFHAALSHARQLVEPSDEVFLERLEPAREAMAMRHLERAIARALAEGPPESERAILATIMQRATS